MSTPDLCALLADHVASTPEQARALPVILAQHAAACARCQGELARARALVDALRSHRDDVTAAPDLAERVWARHQARASAAAPAPRRRPALGFALAGFAGAAVAAVVILALRPGVPVDEPTAPPEVALTEEEAPEAPVGLRVARCFDGGEAACTNLRELDAPLGAVRRFELTDGSQLRLNQGAHVRLADEARRLTLTRGEAWLHVVPDPSRAPLTVALPTGEVEVLGTVIHLRAGQAISVVDVLEGRVAATSAGTRAEVAAGQEAVLPQSAAPRVFTAGDLAEAMAWAEGEDATDEPEDGVTSLGFGTLRARRPGAAADSDQALRLVDHQVQVRVQGMMARTDIEESFVNDTPHELEGVYTFTLPPGAQVAHMSLLVDGVWEEGSMLDRERAEKIWRGVIREATPQQRRTEQLEYIWVPGPWDDPAILSWMQGNTFELRIFPIPGRGERRIRIAYTEVLPAIPGGRRYTYPLPSADGGGVKAERFAFDMRVGGELVADDVQVSNYALGRRAEADGVRLDAEIPRFVPSGDLIVDVPDLAAGVPMRAWAYQPAADGDEERDEAYALLALRPEVPHRFSRDPLHVVFLVDTSYSVQAIRLERAARLVGELTRSLGPAHRVLTLACATTCASIGPRFAPATDELAAELSDRLKRREAIGATRLTAAFEAAREAAREAGVAPGELRVIYLGDGVNTVGELDPGRLRAQARDALGGARLTTVGLGGEVDAALLRGLAADSRGAWVDHESAGSVRRAAGQVLARLWGEPVTDVSVTLPAGLERLAPGAPAVLWPGEEHLLTARMTRPDVAGEVVVEGTLAGVPWEARYRVRLEATDAQGNAFVPRLWAEQRIDALEARDEDARDEIVALSIGHHVLSRHTSLLVLESPAMARAFGVEQTRPSFDWTGEEAGSEGLGEVVGGTEIAQPMAPRAEHAAGSGARSLNAFDFDDGVGAIAPQRPARRRQMVQVAVRRVWYREATVTPSRPHNRWEERQLELREEAWDAERNSRDRTARLVRWHLRMGDVDAAERVALQWIAKDRLDPEALIALADIAALRGDMARSRDLLASAVEVDHRDADAHGRMVDLYRRAGEATLACEHALSRALVAPKNTDAQVEVILCRGDRERHLAGLSSAERRTVERDVARGETPERVAGPFRVTARWDVDAPLDVVIVGPSGQRISWQGGAPRLTVADAVDLRGEALAFRPAEVGRHQVWIVRDTSGAHAVMNELPAVSGSVTVTAYGTTRRLTFELAEGEQAVEAANVQLVSRWRHERVDQPRPPRPGPQPRPMPRPQR